MKRSLLALMCSLVTAHFCSAQNRPKAPRPKAAEQNTLSLPFEDARQMTLLVRIKGRFENLGSAVWIGKTGYLATCYHVVKGIQFPLIVAAPHDPIFAAGNVDLVITGTVNPIDATVVAFDESTDVAILKAAQPPGQPETPEVEGSSIGVTETLWVSKGANLATAIPKPGEMVLLAGYPLNQNTLILETGNTTGEGDFQQQLTSRAPFTNGRRIMLSLVSNPGNSGGPVFDHDGNVVGLLEGNLETPVLDPISHKPLVCSLPKVDPGAIIDVNRPPIVDPEKYAWCRQNSGISIAVPAMFISDLAKKNNIDLR
jgi:S1-C subfamily serine protease